MFRAAPLPRCFTRTPAPAAPARNPGGSRMRPPTPARRWAVRGTTAAFTALALATGMQLAAAGAQASVTPTPVIANPYAPSFQHAYRHGAVPTRSQFTKMSSWPASHKAPKLARVNNLTYGGAIDGIGVTTGAEEVYLVFCGSQWGS